MAKPIKDVHIRKYQLPGIIDSAHIWSVLPTKTLLELVNEVDGVNDAWVDNKDVCLRINPIYDTDEVLEEIEQKILARITASE